MFFNPAKKPGKRLGEKAVKGRLREMTRRNIDTHLGHKIQGFEADKVKTEGGDIPGRPDSFHARHDGSRLAGKYGAAEIGRRFVVADAHCQVPGTDKVFVAGDAGSYPGPDWLPKQAHMADLQAKAAVENLLYALNDQPASTRFKPELVCIVDTLDKGILVYRDEKRAFMLPPDALGQARLRAALPTLS